MIDKPGVYDIPEADYHADKLMDGPTLSSGICKILLNKSPAHARLAHPRLNPQHEEMESEKFDIGTAAHAMLLEGKSAFHIIEADDWRTKAAKEQRDLARANGRVPLLKRQLDEVTAMVEAAKSQIARHPDIAAAFADGKPEQTLIWQERGIWCRLRLDWLPTDPLCFPDYKSTGASAAPQDWGQRTLFDTGADLQEAFYRRGISAVLGIENPVFRFVVQETFAPYALSVIELSDIAKDIADDKVETAIGWWKWCLKHNRWPGYRAEVAYVDPPVWEQKKYEQRKILGEIDRERGIQAYELSMEINQR